MPQIQPLRVGDRRGLTVGDICSVQIGEDFALVKILAFDPGVVHLGMFKDKFHERPCGSKLSLDTIHENGGFRIYYLPLSVGVFASWSPIRILSEPVHEAELYGYRIRREGGWSGPS
jgi:hypothetical protein